MKRILYLSFVFVIIFISSAHSQNKLNVKASFNNLLRYGNGTEILNGNNSAKEYFENLADGRISINDIIFGMRYEISDPIEYGRNFKGLRKRYVEYKGSDIISARAGDFWEAVGRGMTLNTFENRSLGFDTGIDGVRVAVNKTFFDKHPLKLKAMALAGDIEFSDNLSPQRVETYKIRDVNFEISPVKFLNIGTNYVHATGNVPSGSDTTAITADLPELFLNFNMSGLQIFTSYAHKHTITQPNKIYPVPFSSNGDGVYTSVSYSKSGFGVTAEYKDYRFDLTNPSYSGVQRPTKLLPFQNPPTGVKEHTWTLISRNPHVVDFNDEAGGQIEFNFVPSSKLSFILNGAVASKHYRYDYNRLTGDYTREDRSAAFIPKFTSEYNPYFELYLEGEYYANEAWYAKMALSYQNSITFTYPQTLEKVISTAAPIEVHYTFDKIYTIKVISEQQLMYNSFRTERQNFFNHLVSVSLVRSPDFTFTFSTEYTTDKEEPSGKTSWNEAEVSYNINSGNLVTVSYGSERGGLRCTSGICRFVNPFNGFRLTVTSKF
ncbi:MAG TPA: DUF6029 family protein [Ignavibacteria bacterium]|nr:DUF6029 family protein [Ignavibacteria bacterium]